MRPDYPKHDEAIRMENGVRIRRDGQGDQWANDHRKLGNHHLMQDLDAYSGIVSFSVNAEGSLFAEFAPDSFSNRGKMIRNFALVALFDRKQSMSAVHADPNNVSSAFQLWICRTVAKVQPIPPRFFFVCGVHSPWTMLEVDIYSGLILQKVYSFPSLEMRRVWMETGLTQTQERLRQWLKNQEQCA